MLNPDETRNIDADKLQKYTEFMLQLPVYVDIMHNYRDIGSTMADKSYELKFEEGRTHCTQGAQRQAVWLPCSRQRWQNMTKEATSGISRESQRQKVKSHCEAIRDSSNGSWGSSRGLGES